MSFRSWMAVQFGDPTAMMHAYGFVTLTIELGKHWYTGHPPDATTLGTAFGCFVGGGTIDLVQVFLGKKA